MNHTLDFISSATHLSIRSYHQVINLISLLMDRADDLLSADMNMKHVGTLIIKHKHPLTLTGFKEKLASGSCFRGIMKQNQTSYLTRNRDGLF
jgi:hypothetical protein